MVLSGCGSPSVVDDTPLTEQPIASLCAVHNADGATLLTVKAELGARGVFECTAPVGATPHIGARTATAVGMARHNRVGSIGRPELCLF